MRQSSGQFVVFAEGLPVSENGPEPVQAPSCQRDDGLVMALSFGTLAVAGDAAVGSSEGCEGGLVEDALEDLVAAGRATREAGLAGLAPHRGAPCGSGQRIGAVEAVDVANQCDELGRERGAHPRHREDEGRVRVGCKTLADRLTGDLEPVANGEHLAGTIGDDLGPQAPARDGDGLRPCGPGCVLGQGLRTAPAGRGLCQLSDDALYPRGADVYARGMVAEKHKARAGGGVDAPFQRRKEATGQVAQARRMPGLLGDQFAAAADKAPVFGDLRVGRIHGVRLGDDGRVLRVGLALATPDTLPRPVHRQPRHVGQRQPGLGEHGAEQARRTAEHVDSGPRGPGLQRRDLGDQRPYGSRIVDDRMAEQHPRIAVDGAGPVHLPGHVDRDEDVHFPLPCRVTPRHPALAVVALQSDGSRGPISGRDGLRKRGKMRPEPSRTASMASIPASLPSLGRSRGTADAEARMKGKAA